MVERSLDGWLARIEAIHPKSIDMGLDRIRTVLDALQLPAIASQVITVGGTNGKGSTVAYLESIALANSWSVGAYTSPHLQVFNERIRVNGEMASDEQIVNAFDRIEQARGETSLTYFEYATLAAAIIFADASLDLAILEVGLGGRLDATNIFDSDVAIITTVDLDHQDYLGDDRETIGTEKAGIMRAWKPVVLGDVDPPSSVLGHAYRIGASAIRYRCDYFVEGTADPGFFLWREPGTRLKVPMPAMSAPIQMRNAGLAIAAMRALPNSPSRVAVAQGIANARIKGRLQRLESHGKTVYVDVGHNPQAAQSLVEFLQSAPFSGRTLAVYAGLKDKDRAGVLRLLAPAIDAWWIAALPGPRGQELAQVREELAGVAGELQDVQWVSTVSQALDQALAAATAADRVLVFGSFHTVAQALDHLT